MNSIRRSFTTVATKSSSNTWMFLGAAGLVGGGYYYYSTQKHVVPVPALNKEWQSFTLKEIFPVSPDTKRFRFALPPGTTHLGLPTASCVVTKFQDGVKEDGKPNNVIRPYTPIEDPAQKADYFDLIIKRYPDGKMSNHIFNLKVGDQLEIKGPNPKWDYKANEFKHIGMIAGGTGITPMLQVIQRILSDPTDKTKVDLVFANNTEQDILVKDYLDELAAKRSEQFKVHYVVLKPSKEWKQATGYVNESIIKSTMPEPKAGKVFVCGPPPMVAAISGPKAKDYSQGEAGGLLKKLGYTSEDIFKF
ncbi:NADH-cytochrome b5 reductase [Boothiomyces macroporosus]|uniref:NADH-cytochrome b5 reductase n=1 Tax=Boothiomyces macroporosus TaxID=261099 RepID=A0AAD5Y5X5_9FUNG|nr:NADH-cytochrome b5 reductase [Boothiomyces macroporosus]